MGKLERDLIKYISQKNNNYMSWHDDDVIKIFKYLIPNANKILSKLNSFSYKDTFQKIEIETFSLYVCEVDDYRDFVNGRIPFTGSVNLAGMDDTLKFEIFYKNHRIEQIYATNVETDDKYVFVNKGKWVKEYLDDKFIYGDEV